MFRLKEAEIARIKEKNVRIRKIISQLQLDEELVQPSLLPKEQPESLLSVQVRGRRGRGTTDTRREETSVLVTLCTVRTAHRTTR